MDFDAFTEGVEPGGLRSRQEIGILICYMLDHIGKPFPQDDLIEIFQEYGLANYFETVSALAELIEHNNVTVTDEAQKRLCLTKNGHLISVQLHESLSLTTRQRATAAAAQLMKRRKIEKENPVTIAKEQEGGYRISLRITDGLRDLMALSLFVPDMTEANLVKENFHRHPERLYSVILAAALGEKRMLKEALEELS